MEDMPLIFPLSRKYRALAISGYICASEFSSVRRCFLLAELDEPYFWIINTVSGWFRFMPTSTVPNNS